MTTTVSRLVTELADVDPAPTAAGDALADLDRLLAAPACQRLIERLTAAPVFEPAFARAFASAGVLDALAAARRLRGVLNLTPQRAAAELAGLATALAPVAAELDSAGWANLSARLAAVPAAARTKLVARAAEHAGSAAARAFYRDLAARLEAEAPHALYPTSAYRECAGHTVANDDDTVIDAVMSQSTFATIKTTDYALAPTNPALREVFGPAGRCVCVLDRNVATYYREAIEAYFAAHGIALDALVYRALEVDKNLATVERLLGDFKRLGVSREVPVLIAGGGALADTAGLACALYGRNTPYVMLSTSIVTGIDAGPSPRTCCDGFGYKNLMGAYHPPVLAITDRFFFKTLRAGWLRHGVAEIIKMAVVKDAALFADLEAAQPRLVETRFATRGCSADDAMHALSRRVLGGAMRAYIQAEYGNLYETHQCRPHAYGHTWSPGFEIQAGLLHGHAVAIGMGLGAFISYRHNWLGEADLRRVLALISGYGLSLWHEVLDDAGVMTEAQAKIIDKRGGNLVAPLPKGAIGACGYLNALSVDELLAAVADYRALCADYPRSGIGIEARCRDVGLEDPSTRAPAPAADVCAAG